MIGIIFAVVSTLHGLADGVRRGYENVQAYSRGLERKQKGIDNTNTYFDWRGVRRDLDTNEIRTVDLAVVESDGQDRCIRDVYGNVVRNLTEEKRNARKYQAKDNGRTVYLYRQNGNGIYGGKEHREFGGDGYCEGTQFKDLLTNNIYVARRFKIKNIKNGESADTGCVTFYMDLDGFLVREADSITQKRNDGVKVPTVDEVSNFIQMFNDKQRNGNGWNNCKNEMYRKDSFGKIEGMNKYMMKQYYCNENKIFQDV